MERPIFSHLLYPFSGLLVGCLVGLTGVGGGSLMTPLLIVLFAVHPSTAVGSDLLYASVTKLVGTAVHGVHGSVDWRIPRRLAVGSIPTTVLTLGLTAIWPAGAADPHLVSVMLGLVLLVTAILLLYRAALVRFLTVRLGEISPSRITALTILTGAMLGFVVTVTSVGAGAIGVTALVVLYPRVPAVQLVGSDIAHAVPLTLLAGVGHWLLGDVDLGLVGSLLIGSVPGVVIGSMMSFRLPDRLLRIALASVLIVSAVRLLM